ncbi:hypothetical protein H8356DRAFT_1351842 [Neocallimastix lanati (nom. inval.)]|nr:hypothetical protein H8356DRAFT_1351842 [Neocallimastix sp. JGI-2020a]
MDNNKWCTAQSVKYLNILSQKKNMENIVKRNSDIVNRKFRIVAKSYTYQNPFKFLDFKVFYNDGLLKGEKLTKYITYDVNDILKKSTSNGNLTPEDSDLNENLNAEDTMDCTIILTNKNYTKTITLYLLWYVDEKLYFIRIKDIQETMNIIIMHDVLPNDHKSKVIVSSKLTPEQFYEEI